MQNLDPTGEYTNEEVKSALAGADGSRDWSFRYERLSKDNAYIEDIDFVDSCSIDNNIFADIKRSAKFRLMDKGNINYLQDRIKPYVRLNMPASETYDNYIGAISPTLRYKLDDPVQTTPTSGTITSVSLPNGTTYADIANAYILSSYQNTTVTVAATGTSGSRNEFWALVISDGSRSASYQITRTGSDPSTNPINTKLDIYYSANPVPSFDGLDVVYQRNLDSYFTTGSVAENAISFPKVGFYFIRIYDADKTASYGMVVTNGHRVFDSSSKGLHSTVNGSPLYNSTPLVNNGGYSVGTRGTAFVGFISDRRTVAQGSSDGFSVATWVHQPNGSNFNVMLYPKVLIPTDGTGKFAYVTMGIYENRVYISYETYTGFSTDRYWYGELTAPIPAAKLKDGEKHMYSASISAARGMELFIDGELMTGGVFTNNALTSLPSEFDYDWNGLDFNMRTDGAAGIFMDEVTAFYEGALGYSQMRGLYRAGRKTYTQRRGYVEWPQGVFLLSSPSRVLEEGTSAYREVEAYDQLLTLREDSYETRYTAPKGANCVTEVEKILGTEKRVMASPYVVTESNGNIGFQGLGYPSSVSASVSFALEIPSRPGSLIDRNDSMLLNHRATAAAQYTYTASSAFQFAANLRGTSRSLNKEVTLSAWFKPSVSMSATALIGSTTKTVPLPANKWTHVTYTAKTSNEAAVQDKLYVLARITINAPAGTDQTLIYAEPFIEEGPVARDFFVSVLPSDSKYSYGSEFTPSVHTTFGVAVAYSNATRITPSSQTFTESLEWEPGTTKLQIINDILAYINYESAYYDENGAFVAEPYLSPDKRGSEFTYATDENSMITSDDISQTVDVFSIPNKWVLVVSEPDSLPMIGSYTNDDPMSPTSTVARGRTIVDYRTEENASDQATLNAKAARLAFEASQVYEKIEFSTGLMPIHGNGDTYDIIIDELAIRNKYNETAWSMELEAGSTMKHQVRKIVQV